MPYFVTSRGEHPDCSGYGVVKDDFELMGCHNTRQEAVDQMIAISLAEGVEPGGTYTRQNRDSEIRDLPDNYRPALAEDVPEGRACGNCFFYNEDRVSPEGDKAYCERWKEFVDGAYYCNAWQEDDGQRSVRAMPGTLKIGDFVSWNSSGGRARGQVTEIVDDGIINVPDSSISINGSFSDPAALIALYRPDGDGWSFSGQYVGHKFSTLTRINPLPEPSEQEEDEDDEERQVNLTPPAYMRAAARRGLELYAEGKGGDGLVERTIREARAMAAGSVTADKWVRLRAWISRHLVDLDSPAANPESDDYPSPGVVAHLLWGSGPSKRSAQRALEYAEGVVSRIEAENEGRAKGEALSKIETRVNTTQLEIREEAGGMTFSGYAAVFDSPSEPLPFIERIQRGAFRKSLKSRNDVKFLYNHDSGEILGSTRAKTLTLYEDERGLKVEGTLPNTSRGRDVAELLRRGDLDSMSFGFSVPAGGDTWNADGSERTLKSIRLHEVSLVAFPAYPGTAGLQSVRGIDKAAERADVDADSLADALLKIEDGLDITADEKVMLSRVIDSLGPDAEPTPIPELNEGMLLLKKKKLELLMKGL
jgi:HK97 family phage prohead protease